MMEYLRGMASDVVMLPGGDLIQRKLVDLAGELTNKDCDQEDIKAQKILLGTVSPEYLAALNKFDPTVFTRKWPSLF